MKYYFVILLLLLFSKSWAQVNETPNIIRVSGHAEIEVEPSSYVVGIVISETMMNTNYGRPIIDIAIDSMEKILMERIAYAGYDTRKLSVTNVSSNDGGQPFVISIAYAYPVKNLDELRKFFKSVRYNGITSMRIQKLYDVDKDELENKLTEAALKDSKAKAEKLLATAGKSIGPAISIDVSYGRGILGNPAYNNEYFDLKSSTKYSKDINVTYEIK